MDIVLDGMRHLKVDDVVHASDVQAACSHRRCNKYRNATALEVMQCLLTLPLLTVSASTTLCYCIIIVTTSTHSITILHQAGQNTAQANTTGFLFFLCYVKSTYLLTYLLT